MDNLTPREKQIASCVSKGLSNKQIAFNLGIAAQTVRNHLSIIFMKKNVRNRTQLAILKEGDEEQRKRFQEEGFAAFRQVSGSSLRPDSVDEEEEE